MSVLIYNHIFTKILSRINISIVRDGSFLAKAFGLNPPVCQGNCICRTLIPPAGWHSRGGEEGTEENKKQRQLNEIRELNMLKNFHFLLLI